MAATLNRECTIFDGRRMLGVAFLQFGRKKMVHSRLGQVRQAIGSWRLTNPPHLIQPNAPYVMPPHFEFFRQSE
jgi:hypothetical protein